MSGSLNRVDLIGNLGADPELRVMTNGKEVANFSLAITEKWADKSTGERKEKTEWVRIVIFNESLVRVASEYLKKGSKVFVSGQLQTRKWTDKDGQEKYSTEVVLQNYGGTLVMLGGKQEQSAHDVAKSNGYQPEESEFTRTLKQNKAAEAELDDEIGF